MNKIYVDINFTNQTLEKKGVDLISGDYASTEIEFTFDREDGTKMFEMKSPSGELVYADEIVNSKVLLTAKDENDNNVSLFDEEGYYIFEVSLYGVGSKLTSVYGELPVQKEQVIVEGEPVERVLPLFEQLMQHLQEALTETNNLNISASKTDHTTTITITKKDGTTQETQVLDGTSLENIEIDNNDLKVTYGGSTENLGQVCPVIQIGTTTTGQPNTQASVTNTGTALNPIFNFTIPKGEAGAMEIEPVEELPETGDPNKMYLLPYPVITVQSLPTQDIQLHTIYIVESTGKRYIYNGSIWVEVSSDNQYIEYMYINNHWEIMGGIGLDIDLSKYYTKTETDNLLQNKVGFTDYATSSVGGVLKVSNDYGVTTSANGSLIATTKTYAQYQSAGNGLVVGKATLENVITGKGLTTKSYVDGLVGDINSVLDAINGEVI